jgi:hypothetical protein
MRFEQVKELNPLVRPEEKFSWQLLWRIGILLLPFSVMIVGLFGELRFLNGLPVFPASLAGFCWFLVMAPFMVWQVNWSARLSWRNPRVLDLNDRGVRVSGPPLWRKRWKCIRSFRIEPVCGHAEYKLVTVHMATFAPIHWSMLLTDGEQYEALVAELKRHQAVGHGRFTIDIYYKPINRLMAFPVDSVGLIAPLCVLMLGFILFVNASVLLVGVDARRARAEDDRRSSSCHRGGVLRPWISHGEIEDRE